MERYGTWYGAPVYKVERKEYIVCELYNAIDDVFWIIDEGYLVTDNKIAGKIKQWGDRVQVDDSVKEVGRVYYYERPTKIKLMDEVVPPAEEYSDSADEILNSVYTSKLWDEN